MPASYWRKPLRASAAARALGSAISEASSARLFRRSIRLSGIGLSRQLLGLLIDHFPCDQAVFKGRIAIDEATTLLFQVFGTGLGSLGRFQELFQRVVHRHNIYRVGVDCHRLTPANCRASYWASRHACSSAWPAPLPGAAASSAG